MILIQKIKSQFISLFFGIFTVCLTSTAEAASRITFNLIPFGQFQIKVADLEAFVATGAKTPELDYYLRRLDSEQLEQLPTLLTTPLDLHPLAIANFSNSQIGAITIANFAKGIRVRQNRNGFYALRGAIIAAAFDESQLTILNLLRHYPLETIDLDLALLNQYFQQANRLTQNRQEIKRTWFDSESATALSEDSHKGHSAPQDLGLYTWQKRTLQYDNPRRPQKGLFDLYQPNIDRPVPLIAISHGIASNRQTFAYLGQHFASHGFAVAVVEHSEISLDKFDRFLAGKAAFPDGQNLINNPLDISSVLDRLESEPNLDLERVGVVGQSFGGYTALALSGGKLFADQTAAECQTENFDRVLLNLSSLAQCTFNQLGQSSVQLRDPRIKAAIAINPMGGLFGKRGINSVETPTMIISGTHDPIMPAVDEQIEPFVWLDPSLEKYLVLIEPGTHFSFLQEGLGVLPVPDTDVGPRPVYAYPVLKALGTSFFQLHLAQQLEYQVYLQEDRAVQLNSDAFKLAIIRSLAESELEQFP
ncbi:MAG: alpha/beta hydrolase [Cyanobacteria bacterium J06600_6]